MRTFIKSATTLVALAMAGSAIAAPIITDFEAVPGGPTTDGTYTNVTTAQGWTADGPYPIELQRRVAGDPAPSGGNVFVELDSTANASMSRVVTAGAHTLSFLYSPRPGQAASTNGIEFLLNGVLLAPPGTLAQAGGSNTNWQSFTTTYTATKGSILTARAVGTSDSYGGYLDNISISGVPEPTSWAMMIGGFGLVGGTLRRRRSSVARQV